ncbi:hypothetical protein CR513_22303, partial [Mucuna pruriens]
MSITRHYANTNNRDNDDTLQQKHIEAKEDSIDRLKVEREVQREFDRNNSQAYSGRMVHPREGNYKSGNEPAP